MKPAETQAVNWMWILDKAGGLAGAALFGSVCWQSSHKLAAKEDFDLVGVMLLVQLLILTLTYLARRSTEVVSWKPLDWFAGLAGTFALLLFDYSPSSLAGIAAWLLPLSVVAVAFQIAGIASLGRSFGIVAANRGVKSTGMYGFVRHPIYTAYFVNTSVNLATHFSAYNAVVVGSFIGLSVLRMYCEEGVLAQSEEYRTYQTKVRWRVLPGVF